MLYYNSMKKARTVALIFLAIAAVAVWAASSITICDGRYGYEHNAASCLRSIAFAQDDFRANDRDGNGKADYWRRDIAGLYAQKDPQGQLLKLIELPIACADAGGASGIEPYGPRSPKSGYWYRSLGFRDETALDPERFAACAYPVSISSGRKMFLITHKGILFQKMISGRFHPPSACPIDPEREGWAKVN